MNRLGLLIFFCSLISGRQALLQYHWNIFYLSEVSTCCHLVLGSYVLLSIFLYCFCFFDFWCWFISDISKFCSIFFSLRMICKEAIVVPFFCKSAISNCFIHAAGGCANLVLTNGACRLIHSNIKLFSVSNCSLGSSKLMVMFENHPRNLWYWNASCSV